MTHPSPWALNMQALANGQSAPTHDNADVCNRHIADSSHRTPAASPDINSSSSSSFVWSPADEPATRAPPPVSPRYSVSYTDHDEQLSPGRTRRRRPSPLKMSLTGDKIGNTRQGRAGAWFSPRISSNAERTASADATPTKLRYSPLGASAPTSPGLRKPSSPARFSFFSSSVSAALKGVTSSPILAVSEDDLADVDIEEALFPSGAPADGDVFSPAAFKNLQMNAGGLLRKFQSAYQHRIMEFQELKSEHEAQEDEKSEFETRTRHLKMQLEDMARKAAENEATMRAVMEELNREKTLRAAEQRARDKNSISSSISTRSEDLGVEEDQQRNARRSGLTMKSDLSSDTDEDSIEEASVFSRSRSPTLTVSTLDMACLEHMTPPPPPPSYTKPVMLGTPRTPKQFQSQMLTIQKLFKGMSSETPKEDDIRIVNSCRNCQGQDASVAWDTAGLLRDENRGLKKRVCELEEAVDEALDAVNGIRL